MKILSRSQMKSLIGGGRPVGETAPYECICKDTKIAGASNCTACESYCNREGGGMQSCELYVDGPIGVS